MLLHGRKKSTGTTADEEFLVLYQPFGKYQDVVLNPHLSRNPKVFVCGRRVQLTNCGALFWGGGGGSGGLPLVPPGADGDGRGRKRG